MIKQAVLYFISFYQKFLTYFSFGSCRYYPTCSEYAKWQFQTNHFVNASYKTTTRILTCNTLFPGGIDYPVVKKPRFNQNCYIFAPNKKIEKIIFWYVPENNDNFYVIKSFND